MPDKTNVGGRDRLIRAVLAIVLTVSAIRAFRNGSRSRSILAGIAAIGLGFNVATCFCGLNRALAIDTTSE